MLVGLGLLAGSAGVQVMELPPGQPPLMVRLMAPVLAPLQTTLVMSELTESADGGAVMVTGADNDLVQP